MNDLERLINSIGASGMTLEAFFKEKKCKNYRPIKRPKKDGGSYWIISGQNAEGLVYVPIAKKDTKTIDALNEGKFGILKDRMVAIFKNKDGETVVYLDYRETVAEISLS